MKVNEGADVVRPSSFPQDSGPGQTVYGRVLSFTWTKNPLLGQVGNRSKPDVNRCLQLRAHWVGILARAPAAQLFTGHDPWLFTCR
jgi:hypothetical protein